MEGMHEADIMNGQWAGVGLEHHHMQQQIHSPYGQQHDYSTFGYSDQLAHSPGLLHDQEFRLQPVPESMPFQPVSWNAMMGTTTSVTTPTLTAYMQQPMHHHIQAQTPTVPTMIPAAVSMPSSTPSHTSHTGSTARRTLTDADRRQMCLYHEENPNVKQTVIGAMFGVERSTVSKVLRQKEKYLYPDDGSRSPVRKSKGKFPDIERALAVWVRNAKHQGFPLTDAAIRDQARHFAVTTGVSEAQFKANNGPGWLEKFKQKNNVGILKDAPPGKLKRKTSAPVLLQQEQMLHRQSVSTPTGEGEGSPAASTMAPSVSQGSHSGQTESTDNYLDYGYKHQNSVSTTSLSSMYTDAANNSAFSTGPASPASPFFPSDHSARPSPGFPSNNARLQPPPSAVSAAMHNQHRPRSQTFPRVSMDPSHYISPPPSSDPLTPKLMLENSEMTPPSMSSELRLNGTALASPHQTPPGSANGIKPSKDEARKALDTVMRYLAQEPIGVCDPSEYNVVSTLLQRLTVKQETIESSGGFMALMEGTGLGTPTM